VADSLPPAVEFRKSSPCGHPPAKARRARICGRIGTSRFLPDFWPSAREERGWASAIRGPASNFCGKLWVFPPANGVAGHRAGVITAFLAATTRTLRAPIRVSLHDSHSRPVPCKYPPAEPGALRLLAPQRGLIAIGKNKTGVNPTSSATLTPPEPGWTNWQEVACCGNIHSRKRQTFAVSPAKPGIFP
jgi:hypothetical protein